MNYKKAITLCLSIGLILSISNTAFADCSADRCVGSIQRLYTDSTGTLYIATDGNEKALSCTAPAGVYITMPADDENFDRKYAMMLTAMTLENTVGLRIVGGSSNCALSYVYMDN